jgi:GntR family transcriptional repressor for pyruvate dehydrogenase complex
MEDEHVRKPGADQAGRSLGWVTPIRGRRTFEVIIGQLEAALLSGQLYAGARLPTERELAEALDVSRPSVREAFRVLEALGLVDVQRGPNGVSLRRESGDGFASILRLDLALGHYEADMVIELRCVLESWAFAEAARKRDPETFARLTDLLNEMADPELEPHQFNELDVAFHATVVDGCGNELAAMVLRGLRAVVKREMEEGLLSQGPWPEVHEIMLGEHRELFELLRKGDAERVETQVRHHIRTWARQALETAKAAEAAAPHPVPDGTAQEPPADRSFLAASAKRAQPVRSSKNTAKARSSTSAY